MSKTHILNHDIRAREVRVIDSDGAQLGVLGLREAVQIAQDKGMDLTLVSPEAKPPVCRIIDYGKFKYQLKKKAQEAKKHQIQVQVKEIKLRPKTEQHDLDYKVRHAKDFLKDGNKAKFIVQFRGREIEFKEMGFDLLKSLMPLIEDTGHVEQAPKMEGRSMTMIIAPGVKKTPVAENKLGVINTAASSAAKISVAVPEKNVDQ